MQHFSIKYSEWVRSLSGSIMIFVVWWAVSGLGVIDDTLLPSPITTIKRLLDLLYAGVVGTNMYATLSRTLIGIGIASGISIPLGIMIGSSQKIYQSCEMVIEFFRSLPATAMFPLFLLMFGIGSASKIAIAAFLSFWIILMNTVHGVLQSPKTRTKIAQSFGASWFQVLWGITLREALPQILVGFRTALSLSLIVIVVTEMMIGSQNGLGQKIYDSYLTYETTDLYAWLLVTGIVGYVLNKGVNLFEKRFVHWTGR